MTADPNILISNAPRVSNAPRARALNPDVQAAWRWIAWFSLLLALAGLGDWAIALTPARLGSPEWEFGTITATFSGLPLVTMGFAGLLGAALARGIRWQIITIASLILFFALVIIGALIIFLLDVPLALGSVQGVAHLGILKATAKTGLLGALFGVGYAVAGGRALFRALSTR